MWARIYPGFYEKEIIVSASCCAKQRASMRVMQIRNEKDDCFSNAAASHS